MEGQVADIRARLAALDGDREEVMADRHAARGEHDHAAEQVAFLRTLLSVRDRLVDFDRGTVEEIGDPHLRIPRRVPLAHAAALLGVAEHAVDSEAGVAVQPGRPFQYETTDGWVWDAEQDTVARPELVAALVRRLPRDRVRKLLRELGAVVTVARPRPRADYARLGPTPVADRVALEALGVRVHVDASNEWTFAALAAGSLGIAALVRWLEHRGR